MRKTFIRKGIFACIAAIAGIASSFAQTITDVAVDVSACTGKSVSVSFTSIGFTAGTEFTAQLSDASGAFTTPVELGKGTGSPISGTIQTTFAAGTGYKIRVISLATTIIGSPVKGITIKTTPAPPIVPPIHYCVGDSPSPVPAITGSNIKWYSYGNPSVEVSPITSINTSYSHVVGFAYITQTVDGCESDKKLIIMEVYDGGRMPTIINPGDFCQNSSVSSDILKNSVKSNEPDASVFTDFRWSDSANGTFSQTVPVPSMASVGSKDYFVKSYSSHGCPSLVAKVTVNIKATPSAPTVTNKTYSINDPSVVPLSVASSAGTLKWYDTATSTTALSGAPTPSVTAAGTKSYFVSQTVGNCESARAEIVVTVNAATCTTAAPTVANVTYCLNIVSTALTATGTGLKWYTIATDGTALASAPTPVTSTAGTTSYYVSQTLSGCEGPRAKIDVIVNPQTPTPGVVSSVNYAVGASAVALTATGTNLKWYTVVTNGMPLASAPTPVTTAASTTSYFVSQTVNGCEGPRAEIKVIVTAVVCITPAPTVTNVTYCFNAVSTALTATGTGLKWYDAASGGNTLASAPIPSTTTAGTISYYVSQTLNGCEGPRAKIDVTVNPQTPTPGVVSSVNYAVGASAVALTATGTNLKWYTVATNGMPLALAPTPVTTAASTTSYFVSQTVNGCEGPRAEIKVIVTAVACTTPAPTVTNVTYCFNAVSTALTATGTGLKWYDAASGGNTLTSAPIPLTTAAGTISYYVSQTLNGCEGPRAKIDVIVNPQTPAPVAVSPVNYVLNASNPTILGATGTNLKWYTVATNGTPLASAPTPVTTVAGTTLYYVSQTLNNCESPRAEIKVIVVGCSTPAPTVSSPVNYAVGASAVALTATGTNLKWYTAASGGTALASAPIPSTSKAGTISYFVSQTINNCEGPRTEIIVSVASCATLAPTVVTPPVYCFNSTASPLTATGMALKWYSTSSGGTALASAPTPDTKVPGPTSYFVSQTLNGCEGPRAEIKVTVTAETPKPTVNDTLSYCFGETASALTATETALKWYNAAGVVLAAAPTPDTKIVGTISYFVSQTLNGCEGSRAEIKVTVNPVTPLPIVAAAPVKYCFNATTTALTATGTALKWYTAATGGAALSTAPTPSAATAGTISYYVSQTLNGCEGARAKIDVIVSPQTPAPTIAASSLEYCQFVKAPALSATPLTGATLNWYGTNATGGTPSVSAPTPLTDTEGIVTYYVGQTDVSGCASARASISVKTNETPTPILAKDYVDYCQNASATPLVATGTSLKWYLTKDATDFRTTALIPFTEKVSDYSFYVTQTGANTCESAKAEIKVHIKPRPSATISGNPSIPLGGTATITVKFTGDAPWSYMLSNGVSGTTSNDNLPVQVSPTVTTSYAVTEVSNSCGEGIINGSALVTVQIPTLTIGVPSVSESCAGKTFTVQFQQSGSFPDGSSMKAQISAVNDTSKFVSIPSVTSGNVITATIPDTTLKGIYYIRIANIGKDGSLIAAGNVSSGQITVNPLPVATISGATTIYMGVTANLKVDLTGDAPWTFSLNNGLVDSLISTSVNPITVKVTPKTTTTYTISAVSNQCGSGRGAGSARIQVDPVLGTEPPVVSGDWLKIYPTLVDSKCTVEITSAVSAKEAEVEILDLNGRSLFKKSIHQKITEVDFSQRPAGLYLLKVQNGKYTSVQRILKP